MKKSDIISIKRNLVGKSVYFSSAAEVPVRSDVDVIIFLGSEVEWMEDGSFSTKEIEMDIAVLNEKGYYQICLTSIMPLQVCQRLYTHYYPMDVFPSTFGIHLGVPFEIDRFREIFKKCLDNNVKIESIEKLEVLVLVKTCENWVSYSFYEEMETFCRKKNLPYLFPEFYVAFQKKNRRHLLEYTIREMEETDIDCPVLFSCLFRQKYLGVFNNK